MYKYGDWSASRILKVWYERVRVFRFQQHWTHFRDLSMRDRIDILFAQNHDAAVFASALMTWFLGNSLYIQGINSKSNNNTARVCFLYYTILNMVKKITYPMKPSKLGSIYKKTFGYETQQLDLLLKTMLHKG